MSLHLDPEDLPPTRDLLALLEHATALAEARAGEASFMGAKLYAAESDRTELEELGRRLAYSIGATLLRLAELAEPTDLGRRAVIHWADGDARAPLELEELWHALRSWEAYWIEREGRR